MLLSESLQECGVSSEGSSIRKIKSWGRIKAGQLQEEGILERRQHTHTEFLGDGGVVTFLSVVVVVVRIRTLC